MTQEDAGSIPALGTNSCVGSSGRAPDNLGPKSLETQGVGGANPPPRANSVGGAAVFGGGPSRTNSVVSLSAVSLYVVVRGDLPVGLQMAQACHAVREWGHAFPYSVTNGNLIVLSVPGLAELTALKARADEQTAVVPFREPDIGDELTAIALVGGRAKPLLSKLPLAGR